MGQPTSRPGTIAEALARAHQAIQQGRPDEAESLARYVLRSNSRHAEAAVILGHALQLQGRLGEAVAPLRTATQRNPDAGLLTLLAQALGAAGKDAEAIEVLQGLVAREPPYPLAVGELADRLGEAGRLDEASAVLRRALAAYPDEFVLQVALGHLKLRQGDQAGAQAAFEAVRRRAPGRTDAAVGLAQALALAGDFLAAAQLYAAVLERRPEDAGLRIALAKALLELDRRKEAEINLRAVARGEDRAYGVALSALANAPHGRIFLRPSAAAAFLQTSLPNAGGRGSGGDSDPDPAGSP